ncbi:MAG: PEGA domain-containing protein [Candidatus Levybacteria bacterium]|nr:PEGA domain-containing protein [Candidatus Levybacteria bacterium]
MKKIVFFVLLLIVFAALALFFYQFFWVKHEKGALQVTASPQSKVYLGGEYLGTTPLCRCPRSDSVDMQNAQEMLPVGEYTVRLVPESGSFPEFQEKIRIEKSVLTVVDRKFAQGASSEGVVISLTNIRNERENELTIVSLPDKADVYLDQALKGQTPLKLTNLTPSDHTLTLQKAGYKEKSVRIRVTNGYKLSAKGYLGIDPSFIAEATTASSSATPTPSISVAKVRILQTGTGFLRVRDDNSLAGKEITRVTPGEEYTLLSEEEGWFEIELTDGKNGWISAQYAEKVE